MEELFVYRAEQLPEIEGLAEIKAARKNRYAYHEAKMLFERGEIDYEDVPAYRSGEVQELEKKYPRASAYLEADLWSRSVSPIKARLGSSACERLLAGDDPHTVLADMRKDLVAFNLAQEG